MLKDYFLPAPKDCGFRMKGYHIWCGSVEKGDNGRYYMFASRIPKNQPFQPGWMFLSEVVRASSDTPWGPFTFEEVVLQERGAQFWDGRMTHNPRILKWKGKYLLFYVGTSFAFPIPEEAIEGPDPRTMVARSNKRVGVAISDTIDGKFERMDQSILPTRPHCFDSHLTSNPSPLVDADGSVLVMYKSRGYIDMPYNTTNALCTNMEFGIARGVNPTEPYEQLVDSPIFTNEIHLEDPYIWRDKDGYCMIAKDMTGNISGVSYDGVYATSEDAIHWNITRGESSYTRTVLWDDGTSTYFPKVERACLLFEDGVATCAYFAVTESTCETGDMETRNIAIPIKPGITCI